MDDVGATSARHDNTQRCVSLAAIKDETLSNSDLGKLIRLIHLLDTRGPMSVKDIAAEIGNHPTYVSNFLAPIVAAGHLRIEKNGPYSMVQAPDFSAQQ